MGRCKYRALRSTCNRTPLPKKAPTASSPCRNAEDPSSPVPAPSGSCFRRPRPCRAAAHKGQGRSLTRSVVRTSIHAGRGLDRSATGAAVPGASTDTWTAMALRVHSAASSSDPTRRTCAPGALPYPSLLVWTQILLPLRRRIGRYRNIIFFVSSYCTLDTDALDVSGGWRRVLYSYIMLLALG